MAVMNTLLTNHWNCVGKHGKLLLSISFVAFSCHVSLREHTASLLFYAKARAGGVAKCSSCLALLLGVFDHLYLVFCVLESLYFDAAT